MLERPETVRTREADLASVILAAPPRTTRTHDARSALLLALVVGVLAMVVAGTMGLRSSRGSNSLPSSAASTGAVAAAKAGAPPVGAGAVRAGAVPTTPVPGIALAIGRITATPDRASGGMVVRVGVANAGSAALPAARAAQLVLLVDDQVVGRQPLHALGGSGAQDTYSFTVSSCSSGRHAVTAIADATSRVRDAPGSNGARSQELTFNCPYG